MATGEGSYALNAAAAGLLAHAVVFMHGEWHMHAPWLFGLIVTFHVAVPIALVAYGRSTTADALKLAAILVTSFYGSLFASMTTYRLFFHALRRYPGPFWARITKLWHFQSCFGRQNHLVMRKLHEKYGDWVRLGPNELAIFTVQGAYDIHGHQSTVNKGTFYDFLLPETSVVTTRNPAKHTTRKKIWVRSLSENSRSVYSGHVGLRTQQLMESVEKHSAQQKPLDVVAWMSWFSFDCIGDIVLSRPFDMVSKGQWHEIILLRNKAMAAVGWLSPLPWLSQLGLTLFQSIWVIRDFMAMKNWCKSSVSDRLKDEHGQADWSSWFIRSAEKSTLDADEEFHFLVGDAIAALIAGSDTTSSTLVYSLYRLALHESQEAKLYEEIKRLDLSDRDGFQKSVEHLDAFVWEVLRLHPAVPTSSTRVTPPEGMMIDGHFVPGGVTVSTPRYVLGTSENSFVEALDFVPERWTTKPEMVKNKLGHQPFTIGKYSCPGQALAFLEIRLVLANIIQGYRVRLTPGEDPHLVETEMRDQFTALPGPLRLIFDKRIAC